MLVEFNFIDFQDSKSLTKFESQYDFNHNVRLFLEGVWSGMIMFTPPDEEVVYFDPGAYSVGRFWVHFYYKDPDIGEHWDNIWVAVDTEEHEELYHTEEDE